MPIVSCFTSGISNLKLQITTLVRSMWPCALHEWYSLDLKVWKLSPVFDNVAAVTVPHGGLAGSCPELARFNQGQGPCARSCNWNPFNILACWTKHVCSCSLSQSFTLPAIWHCSILQSFSLTGLIPWKIASTRYEPVPDSVKSPPRWHAPHSTQW